MALSLQDVSDRLEIQDLMTGYCYAVDDRDFDALDRFFTADAVIDYREMVPFMGRSRRDEGVPERLARARTDVPARGLDHPIQVRW